MSVALCALLLATGCGAAPKAKPPLPGVKAPGGGGVPVTYVGPAVDYVATYAFWRGFGPKGGDRVTVWRHGHLIRQVTEYIGSKRDSDPASHTTYANLATGASADGVLHGPGDRGGFTLRRETDKTRSQYRYQLVRTDEQRTIAGEKCLMWRADPIGKPDAVFTGVARRACITEDGVVLYDAWLYRGGDVAEERTATKVERRAVRDSEVLPPKEALNWAAWLARAKSLQPGPTGRPVNYDLELKRKKSWDDDPERVRYRASDGWELRESWVGTKRTAFALFHSSSGIHLSASDDSLGITFNPAPKVVAVGSGVKATGGKPGEAVGEQCQWFDTTVGWFDYSKYECRSKDGLPLIVNEESWGNNLPSLTAVSLTRGRTQLRDLMPPRGMMSWTAWGWPELDRR